ncbi:MAG: FAD-dependent oxidoreductase [Myxococcales bacterium]|nr:FAD-dependent oxidoreductase [Myxococcales bacterium]
MDLDVIVIGCGVAGLSSARLLQEAGHRVRIWARELPPRTTSNIAAAFWYPYRVFPRDRVDAWARDSYAAFARLVDAPDAGVLPRQALELFPAAASADIDASWSAALPGARPAPADDLPPGYVGGQLFDSFVVETPRYIPWLRARFLAAGGTIEARAVDSPSEALREADAVLHCPGLGARETAGDRAMLPVRGQLVRVENPGISRVIVDEHSGGAITYVVPRSRDVILGGTSDEGDENLEADPATTEAIVARCLALEPRLAGAARLGVLVGIRPCRPEVRVEREELQGGPVIHNYGHGGAGITLSWGCAAEAVSLLGA